MLLLAVVELLDVALLPPPVPLPPVPLLLELPLVEVVELLLVEVAVLLLALPLPGAPPCPPEPVLEEEEAPPLPCVVPPVPHPAAAIENNARALQTRVVGIASGYAF